MIIVIDYLYWLMAIIFLLSSLLAFIIWTQIRLFRTLLKMKKKNKFLKDSLINREKFAEQLAKELKKVIQKHSQTLSEVSQTSLESYQQALSQVIKQNLTQFNQLFKEIEKKGLASIQAEIKNYRQAQLERAEEQIFAALNEVAQENLGRSLSLKEHEKIVLEALKRIKPVISKKK